MFSSQNGLTGTGTLPPEPPKELDKIMKQQFSRHLPLSKNKQNPLLITGRWEKNEVNLALLWLLLGEGQ